MYLVWGFLIVLLLVFLGLIVWVVVSANNPNPLVPPSPPNPPSPPTPCKMDKDCASLGRHYKCDPKSNVCVYRCLENTDCIGKLQVCNKATGHCEAITHLKFASVDAKSFQFTDTFYIIWQPVNNSLITTTLCNSAYITILNSGFTYSITISFVYSYIDQTQLMNLKVFSQSFTDVNAPDINPPATCLNPLNGKVIYENHLDPDFPNNDFQTFTRTFTFQDSAVLLIYIDNYLSGIINDVNSGGITISISWK